MVPSGLNDRMAEFTNAAGGRGVASTEDDSAIALTPEVGERLTQSHAGVAELQPTASQIFRQVRKRASAFTPAGARDAEGASADVFSAERGEVVSSVLRPKRPRTDAPRDGVPSFVAADRKGHRVQSRYEPEQCSAARCARRSLDLAAAAHGGVQSPTLNLESGPLACLSAAELEHVFSFCDPKTLGRLNCASRFFTSSGITERAARTELVSMWQKGGVVTGLGEDGKSLQPPAKESWVSWLEFVQLRRRAQEQEGLMGLGAYHSAMIASRNGQTGLFTCGRGFHGQLGSGAYDNRTTLSEVTPEAPEAAAGTEGREDVADDALASLDCGANHNAVVTRQGRLYTWGLASSGELGHGGWTPIELNVPKQVACLAAVRIVSVSCGANHTVAVSACGGVWTCGRGRNGQLGHGHLHDEGPMKQVEALAGERVIRAVAGGAHTLALCATRRVYSWGSNKFGQLGLRRSELALLDGGAGEDGPEQEPLTNAIAWAPIEVRALFPSGANGPDRVVSVAAGLKHSMAVTARGHLYTWGNAKYGALGLPSHAHAGDRCCEVPTRVPLEDAYRGRGLGGAVRCLQACAGGNHSAVLVRTSRGVRLMTTGANNYGQLGHGDQTTRRTFAEVRAFSRAGKAGPGARVASLCAGESSTAALTADGSYHLWGRGEWGQLGTDDSRSHWRPQRVSFHAEGHAPSESD